MDSANSSVSMWRSSNGSPNWTANATNNRSSSLVLPTIIGTGRLGVGRELRLREPKRGRLTEEDWEEIEETLRDGTRLPKSWSSGSATACQSRECETSTRTIGAYRVATSFDETAATWYRRRADGSRWNHFRGPDGRVYGLGACNCKSCHSRSHQQQACTRQ